MNKNILRLSHIKLLIIGMSLGLMSPSINEGLQAKYGFPGLLAQSAPIQNNKTPPTTPTPTPATTPTPPTTPTPAETPTPTPATTPTPTPSETPTPTPSETPTPTPSETPTPTPTPNPNPTPAPTTPPTPSRDQSLIGSWETKDSAGETLILTFASEDKLTMEFKSPSGEGVATYTQHVKYHISSSNHLDLLFGNNQIIKTIFEIKDQEKLLRIPLKGLTYQTPRPKIIEPTQVREFTRVEPTNSSK